MISALSWSSGKIDLVKKVFPGNISFENVSVVTFQSIFDTPLLNNLCISFLNPSASLIKFKTFLYLITYLFLFWTYLTASDFWWRLELSHQTILGWVFFKCSYFLKSCCNYCMFSKFPSFYQRKREMNVTFAREVFAFTYFDWVLFLKRFYFNVDNQSACCYS